MSRTGFKEMLRDRIPVYADIALKWCKSKERWINIVYRDTINVFADKNDRYDITKTVLGLKSKDKIFNFDDTIYWDALSEEERKILKVASSWVNWFKYYFIFIENEYKVDLLSGCNEERIISELCSGLLKKIDSSIREDLAIFIIKYLKK
jgi:hypothetical protein